MGQLIDAATVIESIEEKTDSVDIESVSAIVLNSLNITTNTENISNHIENIIKKHMRKKATQCLLNQADSIIQGVILKVL